ncbi:MAG: histidinol-phosphate transaminase [Chloroflexi bacterium]|nr:histidinol-phosphate transaminase [Chloroflexota bacterium]
MTIPNSPFTIHHSQFIRPDIVGMEPYTPIVPFEVLSRQLGFAPEEIVKLDANENPYGPSPKALAAMQDGRYYHIYPDPAATELREAISGYVGVPAERLVVGMGADELIDLVLRVVLAPQDKVLDCPPSFGMYPFSTYVNLGQYVTVNRTADFGLDVAGIEAAVASHPPTKLLFLCSPNNPSGNLISDDDLRRLLQLPVLVVLDEAYIEFAQVQGATSHIGWTADYDNLCVLRTFSKLAGLAGLRVGYGAFPTWLVPHLMKIKQPYNVNVAANLAAQGALQDVAWLEEHVALLVQEREAMTAALAEFDFLRPFPSQSNFVLCEVVGRSAKELKLRLQSEYGVLVRHYSNELLNNYIRITAGRPQDTARLLAALRSEK